MQKREKENCKENKLVNTAKIFMLKLVSYFKVKHAKSLKIVPVDMKTNSSILMRLEMD